MVASRRYDFVDLLRGIAAMTVLVCHYRWFFARHPSDWRTDISLPGYSMLWPIYDHGEVAVFLFWILSGFVFAVAYGRFGKDLSVREFAIHRVARLYPLHLATLFFMAALQAISMASLGQFTIYPNNDVPHFLQHLAFASNWFTMESSFNAPIWSVSIEVLIYGLFLIYLKRTGLSFWPAIAIGLAAFVIERLTHNRLALCAALFFGGVLLQRFRFGLGLSMVGFATAIAVTALTGSQGAFIYLGTPTLLAVFIALDDKYRLPEQLRWIGLSTYSIYLLHMPILVAIKLAIGPIPLWLFIAIVLVAAILTFHFFERPAQDHIRARWLTVKHGEAARPSQGAINP